jgi:hypothetical protein
MGAFANDQERQLYDAVIWWQNIELFHPLECIENGHRSLEATIREDGTVCLFCQDCDYEQPVPAALAGMMLAAYSDKELLDEQIIYKAPQVEDTSE